MITNADGICNDKIRISNKCDSRMSLDFIVIHYKFHMTTKCLRDSRSKACVDFKQIVLDIKEIV